MEQLSIIFLHAEKNQVRRMLTVIQERTIFMSLLKRIDREQNDNKM